MRFDFWWWDSGRKDLQGKPEDDLWCLCEVQDGDEAKDRISGRHRKELDEKLEGNIGAEVISIY